MNHLFIGAFVLVFLANLIYTADAAGMYEQYGLQVPCLMLKADAKTQHGMQRITTGLQRVFFTVDDNARGEIFPRGNKVFSTGTTTSFYAIPHPGYVCKSFVITFYKGKSESIAGDFSYVHNYNLPKNNTGAITITANFTKDTTPIFFNYSKVLTKKPTTLFLCDIQVDAVTGILKCNGGDSARSQQPFRWEWGDGTVTTGYFPQTHSFGDTQQNYRLIVSAFHSDGIIESVDSMINFIAKDRSITPISLPLDIHFRIPKVMPNLHAVRAPYGVNNKLIPFDDRFFTKYPRETVEYLLSLAASVEVSFANGDVCRTDGKFDQIALRDPPFGGMYSLWYTEPICFGVGGDDKFQLDTAWSSFFHEMGHNVTLNTPEQYYWGFKQDGNANCIYSETMAQIMQHATAYELVNHHKKYGIGEGIADDIAISATNSMDILRNGYMRYCQNGMHYTSWNDPATPGGDIGGTFMTIAYLFISHAEQSNQGYFIPVKRMLQFLQSFNAEWEKGFSSHANSPEAERFRATLMTAALSYAFSMDVRQEFRDHNFPVDDMVYRSLMETVRGKIR